uniref:Uncharacterized protein n=1 Tax=Oryza punctata TaxID=4537 RepID=A0A0E0JDN5_ORYPU
MKRTRAQQPKLQEGQDGAGVAGNANPKPQRRAKQPRQPKAATAAAAKKAAAAAARESSSSSVGAGAAVASAASSSSCSSGADMAPTVPDVCGGGGGGGYEAGAATTVEWDLDGGLSNGSSWWTFGVEEEKLLGWFPFVEEDFRCLGGRGDAEMAFDDDIWRIHQIYEIPNYAAK